MQRPSAPAPGKRNHAAHSCQTFLAYLVWMLYPSDCLVSPAITEKSLPAMARMVPPLSE
jgi:hypothetical protein